MIKSSEFNMNSFMYFTNDIVKSQKSWILFQFFKSYDFNGIDYFYINLELLVCKYTSKFIDPSNIYEPLNTHRVTSFELFEKK